MTQPAPMVTYKGDTWTVEMLRGVSANGSGAGVRGVWFGYVRRFRQCQTGAGATSRASHMAVLSRCCPANLVGYRAHIHAYSPPPRTRLRGKEWQPGILAFASNPSRILSGSTKTVPGKDYTWGLLGIGFLFAIK